MERNQVLEAIGAGGFNLNNFEISQQTSDRLFVLNRLLPGTFFEALALPSKSEDSGFYWGVTWFIGQRRVPARPARNWPQLMSSVTGWVREIGRQTTPEMLERSRTNDIDQNAPFTRDERALIAAQLREMKNYLGELHRQGDLTAAQVEHLSARFDEAEEASGRIGRKDWRLLFAGLVFTLTATDAIPPEVAKHIVVTAVQGLAHVFSGLPPMITY
jgi:hypothetical protein